MIEFTVPSLLALATGAIVAIAIGAALLLLIVIVIGIRDTVRVRV